MIMTAKATPASSAEDRTSITREWQDKPHKKVVRLVATLTIIFDPPRKVSPPNVVIEDEADDRPWDVVERRRRRNRTQTAEDDREADTCRRSVQGKSTMKTGRT